VDTTIQKWGNSLAIRIPKAFADEIGLHQGSQIDIRIVDGQLVIRPVHKPAYDLSTLLNQVTEDNLHLEIDTGASTGEVTSARRFP
jgi:antitoxin MazE